MDAPCYKIYKSTRFLLKALALFSGFIGNIVFFWLPNYEEKRPTAHVTEILVNNIGNHFAFLTGLTVLVIAVIFGELTPIIELGLLLASLIEVIRASFIPQGKTFGPPFYSDSDDKKFGAYVVANSVSAIMIFIDILVQVTSV